MNKSTAPYVLHNKNNKDQDEIMESEYGFCAMCTHPLEEPLKDLRLMYCYACQNNCPQTNLYIYLVGREDIGWAQSREWSIILNQFKDIFPYPYNTLHDNNPVHPDAKKNCTMEAIEY